MKAKMTRNEIASLPVNKTVTAGYCELHYLLADVDPVGYNSGVNGWNYDVYVVDGICILTGYRVPNKYPKAVKAEIYETRAREIRMNYRFSAIEMHDHTANARRAFCIAQLLG